MMVSHSYRSHNETRVVNLHMAEGQVFELVAGVRRPHRSQLKTAA